MNLKLCSAEEKVRKDILIRRGSLMFYPERVNVIFKKITNEYHKHFISVESTEKVITFTK